MSTIEKLMSTRVNDLWTISAEDSVFNAIKKMTEKKSGALPVVKDERLIGIISERDYTRKVILEGRTSKETLVKDIMTEKVFHTFPEQKIEECMMMMTKYRIRHLPVIEHDKLIGMISIGDVVAYIISDQKFKIEQLESSLSWGESY